MFDILNLCMFTHILNYINIIISRHKNNAICIPMRVVYGGVENDN